MSTKMKIKYKCEKQRRCNDTIKETLPRRNNKTSLSLFPRYIAKCHQVYNLVESKDPIEQNKSSSLEVKCKITRIEVDYSYEI